MSIRIPDGLKKSKMRFLCSTIQIEENFRKIKADFTVDSSFGVHFDKKGFSKAVGFLPQAIRGEVIHNALFLCSSAL